MFFFFFYFILFLKNYKIINFLEIYKKKYFLKNTYIKKDIV